MLDTLIYNVTFPTGRKFDRTINFKEGMTAIIGPNEQGKSLTLEMVRFGLFGSAALRGGADDYKHLQMTLIFVVRGRKYQVVRSTKNAVLGPAGGETTARGTKPVNARILEILGFDLAVFDVACAANQGEVERLGQMPPTARRAMVDRLIGADRIEEIVDWAAEQALLLKREIDVLERGVVLDIAPAVPLDYVPLVQAQERLDQLHALEHEAVALRAFLRVEPANPVEPVVPHDFKEGTLDYVETLFSKAIFDFNIEEVDKQYAALDLWNDKQRFLRDHPLPTTGVTSEYAAAEILRGELTAELARLRKSQVLACPSCGHRFTLADEQIATVEASMPPQTMVRITTTLGWDAELRRARDWESTATREAYAMLATAVEAPKPDVSRADLEAARTNGMPQRDLDAELDRLGLAGVTRGAVLVLRRQLLAYEAAVEAYEPARATRAEWEVEAAARRARLTEVEEALLPLPDAAATVRSASLYEQALALYEASAEAQRRLAEEIEDKRAERQSWVLGKDQLNALRLQLKGYLAPSLSKAASALLSQMTRGARREIWVDETFEITVDGQALRTLSGSGKVCANLALRLGLAQVLTNNVFSVFMGDEMDAFMDEERVTALNESLERLTGRVKQIIVITHKPPLCKQVIDLGKST